MSNQPECVIQPDGSFCDSYKGVLGDDSLRHIVEVMIFNRVFEKRMLLLQRQGRIGFSLTSTGEEGIIIGATHCLKFDDPIFLSYRELGSLLYRGVPLKRIVNQFYGNSRDYCKGRQMPVHYCFKDYHIPSVSSPVGTQLLHACGMGYASKLQGHDTVALAFLGEGTASSNDFHSALNFSGVLQSKVVFIIRNNGYAISTPESVQTKADNLACRATGYGIEGIQINGNDILQVVKTVQYAVDKARQGDGPTLIEAMTYRLGAHSSSDDPSCYRDKSEEAAWEKIDVFKRTLQLAHYQIGFSKKDLSVLEKKADEKMSELILECEQYPEPKIDSLFDEVYDHIPLHLQAQKDQYLDFLVDQELGGSHD